MKKHFRNLFVIFIIITLCGCSTNNIGSISIDELLSDELSSAAGVLEGANQVNEFLEAETAPSSDGLTIWEHTADNDQGASTKTEPDEYDYVLIFPSDSYPETALHIYNAIENGHSDVCTIDREGADDNRKESLKGIDTMKGYDRDEWPMAMCEEGGYGASIAYIDSSDNRGAGSWVGHQLSAYENGERILFIVEKPKLLFGEKEDHSPLNLDEDVLTEEVVYNNCDEAVAAGVTPLFEGEPGYSRKLDRDGDGIACEAKYSSK